MNKIAIIHFSPLELYPPVQNFLNLIADQGDKKNLLVFTTAANNSQLDTFLSPAANISIIRIGRSGGQIGSLKRYFNYMHFYSVCLLKLIITRPKKVLYYETISSYPAYLYKKIFNTKAHILVHYHEYTAPGEYTLGMKLTRYFHHCEKWLYPKLSWISHTNEYRMQKFKEDIFPVKVCNDHIVPNYPPAAWQASFKTTIIMPVKIVYAGALGMDTMFTATFANWVIAQKGKVCWDIYSYNITHEAKRFINELATDFINLKPAVNYNALPEILSKYDVGVILYNGHILNYVYNQPNKLFEYLSCGLDVWFPDVMTGSMSLVTAQSWPKIVALDFSAFENYHLEELLRRENCVQKKYSFYCEIALKEMYKEFILQK